MMRHAASHGMKTTLVATTSAPVGNYSSCLLSSVVAPFEGFQGNISSARRSSSTMKSSVRRHTGGIFSSPSSSSISPRSPILVGCALACAASPLISVRNFSSNPNVGDSDTQGIGRHAPQSSSSISSFSDKEMESWKVRAEAAEKHLKELRSVLEREATSSSSATKAADSSKQLLEEQEEEKKLKDKEIEDAFQSIASGAKRIFMEIKESAEKTSGSSASLNNGTESGRDWEKKASIACHHSHCRSTGKCHYGCQERHNFHNRYNNSSSNSNYKKKFNFDSKNFCKPVSHRRSLPTKLAMLGLGGLLVYCMGSLAMLVGTVMMLSAAVVPAAIVIGFYYLFTQYYPSSSDVDQKQQKNDQSTNTCTIDWNREISSICKN